MAQFVDHLPNKHKVLDFIYSTIKNKIKTLCFYSSALFLSQNLTFMIIRRWKFNLTVVFRGGAFGM
jgi:hypothetical protein